MAIVLAVAFTAGGLTLILLPQERYRDLHVSQHWAEDYTSGQLKAIGTIKTTGAVGLVLPAAVGVAPVLVPLAASGLMLIMAGAGTTRFRRREYTFLVVDLIFLAALRVPRVGEVALEPFGG